MCPECKLDLYNNVASAVGLFIMDKDGRLLMEKRAKEPRKGFLALPGGFTDYNETAEEAAFRECREEIGVEPLSIKYLCSFSNDYEYKTIKYKTCDLFFLAQLPMDFVPRIQEKEVESVEWVTIRNQADIEKTPMAFQSAIKALKKWLLWRDQDESN